MHFFSTTSPYLIWDSEEGTGSVPVQFALSAVPASQAGAGPHTSKGPGPGLML